MMPEMNSYKCENCGESFWSAQEEDRIGIDLKCPKCKSGKVRPRLEIKRGPHPESPFRKK